MNIALVYQAGIANVFRVGAFNSLSAKRGETIRLRQADFRSCASFAAGAAEAGADVRTYFCNMAGDISAADWTRNIDDAPFKDQLILVETVVR